MRLHTFLLHLYPSSFRSEYGEELSYVFSERRRQAANPLSILYLWLSEFADILANASRAHWDILRQDLRYTARTMARTPGFTLTAVIVTALGIGANTAVFSITDHVLLRHLPFADSDRLVQLWEHPPAYSRMELSPPNFQDWRRLSTSFEAMSAYTTISANLLGRGEPRRLEGATVTPDLFPILGLQPAIGRIFAAADAGPEVPPTVILSYGLWQAQFAGRPDILGTTIRLDSGSRTVIGVMPADFFFPSRTTQMWTPLVLVDPANQNRGDHYLMALAKLKPGVKIEQARAEMNVIAGLVAFAMTLSGSMLPAIRAMRTDPTTVIRGE